MLNTVAIVGINGTLGKPTIDALTTQFKNQIQLPVRAVTRDLTKVKSNALIQYYKANDKSGYKRAFENVDVVIDFRGHLYFQSSNDPVIYAASEQGVQVFIPSNFGTDFTRSNYKAVVQNKFDIGKEAESLGLKVVNIDTGFFVDWNYGVIDNPWLMSIDKDKNVYYQPGDGETKVAVSFLRDVGLYVARAVTKPLAELPTHLRVYSAILTYNEFAALYERAKGVKLTVVPVTLQEELDKGTQVLKRGPAGFADFITVLKAACMEGSNDFSDSKDNMYLNPGLFTTGDLKSIIS